MPSEPKFKVGQWLNWDIGAYAVVAGPFKVEAVEYDQERDRWRYRLGGVEYPVYEEVLSASDYQPKKVMADESKPQKICPGCRRPVYPLAQAASEDYLLRLWHYDCKIKAGAEEDFQKTA